MADRIVAITATIEAQRDRSFCNQIRAASQSACANIAEGFGRFGPREFARFLRIARGSLTEVQEHLHDGHVKHLVSGSEYEELLNLSVEALGAITPLIRYLHTATPPPLDDPPDN